MAAEYDLVVIGSSLAGIYAAQTAAKLQARVALVTQSNREYLPNDTLLNYSLGITCQFSTTLINHPLIATAIKDFSLSGLETKDWLNSTIGEIHSLNSLSYLASIGVDIIVGKGKFSSSPDLRLQIKRRSLNARRFLLATGSRFVPDFLEQNITKTGEYYLTLRDLANYSLFDLPENLIVIGGNPTALAIAQTLVLLEKKVTLIIEQSRILPQEDHDLSILIQAQLEADGIEIIADNIVSQIKIINQQKWLQVGNQALVADEIIIADYRQPNIAGLNLSSINVQYNQQRVYVNRKLETTNPRIYACGELIGGYCLPNIAQYEVNIILKNTLFLAKYKTNYHAIPWAILTQPSLARVGLTEMQAKQKYSDVYVVRQYFNTSTKAKILNDNSGFCKLVLNSHGEILGCSIFSNYAMELINLVALMIQHKIKLERNPMKGLTSISIPHVYPSMAEIINQAVNSFYYQKIQQDSQLLNRLKKWFSIRKN